MTSHQLKREEEAELSWGPASRSTVRAGEWQKQEEGAAESSGFREGDEPLPASSPQTPSPGGCQERQVPGAELCLENAQQSEQNHGHHHVQGHGRS